MKNHQKTHVSQQRVVKTLFFTFPKLEGQQMKMPVATATVVTFYNSIVPFLNSNKKLIWA